MRNMQPALDPIIIPSWQKADDLPWDTRLSKAGNYKDPNTVIIIDDAQLTYWDVAFWNQFLKTIVGAMPPSTFRVILFAAYGSPEGRATLGPEGSPTWIPAHCRIGLRPVVLDEDPITPAGLLLTFEEFADMVKKICPEELFKQDFLDYMFCATAGQAGAVADLLRIVTAHDVSLYIKLQHSLTIVLSHIVASSVKTRSTRWNAFAATFLSRGSGRVSRIGVYSDVGSLPLETSGTRASLEFFVQCFPTIL